MNKKEYPEYKAWIAMKTRCYNPKSTNYHNWGGRGIRVCERWLNSYDNFISDMGPRPIVDGYRYSLDRIDNDKDYSPENCRWSNHHEQMNNTRYNILLECDNEILNLKQWSNKLGLSYHTLLRRYKQGWSSEKILKTPVKKYDTRLLEYNGQLKPVSEWANIFKINLKTLGDRLDRGWETKDALETPINTRHKRKTDSLSGKDRDEEDDN